MADSDAKSKMKNSKKTKKRKGRIHDQTERLPKVQCIESVKKVEERKPVNHGHGNLELSELEFDDPWKNLQLILGIQNKQLDAERKVQLAFNFVQSRVEEGDGTGQDCEIIKLPRLLYFLNDWIQSLLTSSDKKNWGDGKKPQVDGTELYMDFRCWEIFKFCLLESLKLHVPLNISRNLLQPVHFIAKNALLLLEDSSIWSKEPFISDERYKLYDAALESISLVFSSHGGISNKHLDSWLSATGAVVELVQKMYDKNLDCSNMSDFALCFLCLMLQPFSKFLRVHPAKKSGFHDFLDMLLEPLLHLLGELHLQVGGSNPIWTEKSLKVVEEVLAHGLFHPVHIDGFLSLHGSEKYANASNDISKGSKTVIKSYHRHLFDVLYKIISRKNAKAMGSIGFLFHFFVNPARKFKGSSALHERTKTTEKMRPEEGETHSSSNMCAETRKSVFNFFVQMMGPLLIEVNAYLQAKTDARLLLSNLHDILKSISNLLSSFMQEKVYARTEDVSGGACLNFFREIYNVLISCSTHLLRMLNNDRNNKMELEIFTLSAKEILVAIGYLLEIEYEVIGENLMNLWLIMFSYLAINCAFMDVVDQSSLFSSITGLGCQIIYLYSQLRQVKIAILSLCKAIRLITSHDGCTEECFSWSLATLSSGVYSESVEWLLSSKKFIDAIHIAIKSIPEGQVSGFIRQLIDDVSESLRWIKDCSPLINGDKFYKESVICCSTEVFDVRLELLGRLLSRLYALVLDSVTVTEGNSKLLGIAIKEVVALMRPCLSNLVGRQPAVGMFLLSVLGKTASDWIAGKEVLKKFGPSSQWVLVFFFNLFLSCRSLFRQAISLMTPGLSKKMSAEVGDFTAYSASELMQRLDNIDMSYFSWIVRPASSLLLVIQIISDIYFQDGSADCSCLIHIFHSMALQRLVDLNRQIVLFNYFPNNDSSSKIKALKDEAAGLTNLMMQNLSYVYQSQVCVSDDITEEDMSAHALHQNFGWDLGVFVACKKSLPAAIWSDLCKNIDVWSHHAAKKQLKKFISHLLHTSLHCVRSNFQELGLCKIDEDKLIKRVTLPQISLELLSNSILYEQKFVCRILASTFCRLLEKSVQQLFTKIAYTDVNLRTSPKWPEFLNVLDNSAKVFCGIKDVPADCSAVGKLMDHSCDKLPEDIRKIKRGFRFTTGSFTICHHLLNLLCWMPDRHSKSISRYVACIFNLERLIVNALLNSEGRIYQGYYYELLRLFVSCRKTLRYRMMGEKAEAGQSLPDLIISEGSFPVLWLFKSVSAIIGLEVPSSEHHITSIQSIAFSLMDHTSHVLSGMGKYQLIHALSLEKQAEKPSDEMSNSGIGYEDNHLLQSSHYVDSPLFEVLKNLTYMADNLNEQTKSLLVSLRDDPCYGYGEFRIPYGNMNRLSSTVSCLSGFLWGLASVLDLTNVKGSDRKEKMLMWKLEHASELNICVYALVEFIHSFVHKLLVEDNHPSKSLCDFIALQKVLEPENENSIASVLMRIDSFELPCLNKPLLQTLLKGNHPEASFLLGQLFVAFSAFLRLNTHRGGSSLLSNLIPTFVEISQVLLLEFTKMVEVPQQSAFLLLDGVLTYLRELAYYFPLTDPTSSRKVYERLIELYLRAIGKAISLQGKRATLNFHERQSSTKTLNRGSLNVYSLSGLYCFCLDEFKVRLRMSFKAYIEKQSELHLLSTIQAIERALVGVQEQCTIIYDIKTSLDGGSVSSLVAAGIDCFDMVLEFVSGRKGLKLIKRHIQSLVAAVFNIILHLKSPHIFHGDLTCGAIISGPDPGSVILMCVEVLATISRKHVLFQIDAWHVGYLLQIPAALFLNFHQLGISDASASSESLMNSKEQISHPVATVNDSHVDLLFSINLFSACCQLLCTIIKHHPSECKICVAHLEASVAVLLNCLETVENKSILSWKVEGGVKCACFLRRVYEEIKEQKDAFSRQCSLFLSNYIWVYSGYGPKRGGIRREIDEALRPGVYALIDACSVDDLQYLHTVFGEGPCRNTLGSLQHDYKLNFKYEGKV